MAMGYFFNAVIYRAKTGVPWRDLPERFGIPMETEDETKR